jgi:tetratricopeptide (TPR) repeat protein
MSAERGSLESISVPQLLAESWRDRRSGCLRLSRGKSERVIQIADGAPTGLETSLADDHFAEILEQTGRLKTADRVKVEKLAEQRECSQASAVLALGVLDPKTLYQALRQATRTQISETFDWREGEHRWTPPTPDAKPAGKPFDILQLLQAQLPKRWGIERLFEALMPYVDTRGDIAPQFRRVVDKLGSSGPIPEQLIQRLDGSTSIGQILGDCAGDPLAASTLWVLLHAGLLRLCDGSDQAPAPLVEIEVTVAEERGAASRDDVGSATAARGANAASRGRANDKAMTLRAEVDTLLDKLGEISHYEALGLDADAGPTDIKKAYFKEAKKYHPDTLARIGLDDIREDAARVFARLAEAYEVLSDKDKKKSYDSGDSEPAQIDTARLTQAETSFRKGEILLKMGNFLNALDYLKPAVELWPEEPAYQALLGWAYYKQPKSDPEHAREHLAIADKQEPNNAVTLFRLSLVLRSLDEMDAAEDFLTRARALDPDVEG